MAEAGTAKGQQGVGPYIDVAKAVAADIPVYALTGAAGAIGGRAAVRIGAERFLGRAATDKAVKAGGTAGVAAMEGLTGAAQETTRQRTEQEEAEAFGEEPAPLDPVAIGAVGLFSAAISAGGVLGASAARPQTVTQQGQALATAIAKHRGPITPTNPNAPLTPVEQALVDPLRDNMDKVHDEYMKLYGKELLNRIDPVNVITDAKIRTDMSKAAIRVALRVVELDDNFKLKPNEQVLTRLMMLFSKRLCKNLVSLLISLQQ
jgi:hypothetical protein